MRELLNETMTRGAHELDMARMERANRRQWVVILLLIVLLVGSNAGWLYFESQFTDEITTTTIDAEQDGNGVNTVVGGDYEPKSEGNDHKTHTNP